MDYAYLEKQLLASKLFEVTLALIYSYCNYRKKKENKLNLFILDLGKTKRDEKKPDATMTFQASKQYHSVYYYRPYCITIIIILYYVIFCSIYSTL